MKLILNHFQIVIHALDDSLGFFEHISEDLGLEKLNTGLHFGNSFISSNLSVDRQPVVNSCIGGCGLNYKGYKRHACSKCSMNFVLANTDKILIEINNSVTAKLRKEYHPTVINKISAEQFTEMMISNAHPNFKKAILSDVFMNM